MILIQEVSKKEIPVIAILHAYQPPTQTFDILDRIVENCYLPIARSLEENPTAKITLNMNASLCELLEDNYTNVIEKYSELARNDQVEFLDSGAYHPILPLLSRKEAKMQIEMNKKINSRIFGSIWNPCGLWPPELAVSEDIASLVESLGYKYIIVPEISLNSNSPFPNVLFTRIPIHPSAPSLALINRNREISNNISFTNYQFFENLKHHFAQLRSIQPNGVVIFGSDLETFGEHHQGYEKFLIRILNSYNSKTVSEILDMPRQPIVEFRSSSWSTSEEDLYRDIPFPLWAYPGNSIHELLNFHSDLLSEAVDLLLSKKDETDLSVKQALKSAAKAQYSCQTWWASVKGHFSKELIMKGFFAQKTALEHILKAIGSENKHNIIQGVSDRLEKRLERYLARIR